jgi:hypothetical protein
LRILIVAASGKGLDWYLPFLIKNIQSEWESVRNGAADVLFDRYSENINSYEFLNSPSLVIRRKAAGVIFQMQDLPGKDKTANLLCDKALHATVVGALKDRISREPQIIPILFERYRDSERDEERLGYASVLTSRLQYFILKLDSTENADNC